MTEFIIRIIADYLLIVIGLVCVYLLLRYVDDRRRYQTYVRVLLAGVTSYLVAKIAALFYQPAAERPFEMLGVDPGAAYLNNPGFPSDHALFATFLVLAVWYATGKHRYAAILFVGVVVMGAGRVIALVHTPLDVIGGIGFGLLGGVWYLGRRQRTSAKRKKSVQ